MEKYAFFILVVIFIVFIIFARFLISPMKRIFKFAINSFLGITIMLLINLVGSKFGFHLGINWWTIACTGIFGIPGCILIVLITLLLQ